MELSRFASDLTGKERLLDEVLTSYLKAVDAGSAPSQQDLLGQYPELASELREFFANQDRFDRVAAPLRAVSALGGDGAGATDGASFLTHTGASRIPGKTNLRPGVPITQRNFGDYEILDEIGQGGMGIVYRARQVSLKRIVAVKMIRPGVHMGTEARERFRREAHSAARLQHPHIVQIFEIGEHAGRPYITLEFVRGGNLAQRLDGTPLPGHHASELVELLARAIHYAHQQGIVHRDLKPANILLTEGTTETQRHREDKEREYEKAEGAVAHGCARLRHDSSVTSSPRSVSSLCLGASVVQFIPKITDFGLAKQLDDTRGQQTETGMIVGTPSYMAPEQAQGKVREVGPATDIYALGTMLYEMLTGRPPFKGATRLDTLRQVVNDEPVPPRSLQSDVPRDLSTICLKCLEKDPRKRYRSAQRLADDLQRFREGRPIKARPTRSFEHVWRWACRQPVPAALALGLAVSMISGLVLVFSQWWRAETNAREANRLLAQVSVERDIAKKNLEESERQRERADRGFVLAHSAVKDFDTRVTKRELPNVPGAQPLRKELLESTVEYYRKFVEQNSQDPALKAELAGVRFRLAQVTDAIGSKQGALKSYEEAQALYRELLKDKPGDLPYRVELARTCNNMGILQDSLGQHQAALGSFKESRLLWDDVLKEVPKNSEYLTDLASTNNNIGALHAELGQLKEGLASFEEARRLREQLAQAHPRKPDLQSKLANSDDNIGLLHDKLGDAGKAMLSLENARTRREKLVAEHKNAFQFKAELAQSYRHIGDRLRKKGQTAEALELFEKGHKLAEEVVKANPHVTHYQSELAACCNSLGIAQRASGEPDKAIASYEQSAKIYASLENAQRDVPYFAIERARALYNIGVVHGATNQNAKANDAYAQARAIQERLVAVDPDRFSYRIDLTRTLNNHGVVLGKLGRTDEGVKLLEFAITHQRVLLKQAPQLNQTRPALSNHYGALAEVLRAAGRADAAVKATQERQQFCTQPHEFFAAAREIMLAAALPEAEPASRERYAGLALAALRLAVEKGFKDAERLRTDPDLAAVRDHPEFTRLLENIAPP